MTVIGILLEASAAKKPAKKSGGGTTITIKTGGSSGGKPTDAKGGTKSAAGGKSKAKSPEAIRSKGMGDLLKFTDEMTVFSRQKAHEHGQWENFHNKSRVDRHLANLHREIRHGHENLRSAYQKLGNEAYRITKPKDKLEEKKPKPKKKTLKEYFDLNESKVERKPVKWPTQSKIAGRKRQDEIDKERAILNAGGLPPGWKMIGGRKVKVNEIGDMAMMALSSGAGMMAAGFAQHVSQDIYHHGKKLAAAGIQKLKDRKKAKTQQTMGGPEPTQFTVSETRKAKTLKEIWDMAINPNSLDVAVAGGLASSIAMGFADHMTRDVYQHMKIKHHVNKSRRAARHIAKVLKTMKKTGVNPLDRVVWPETKREAKIDHSPSTTLLPKASF